MLAKWGIHKELRIRFDFNQVVLALPDKWNAFKFSQCVPLSHLNRSSVNNLSVLLSGIGLGEQKVENELFAPLDNALDHVECEHAETVEDVDALLQQRG